MRILKYDTAPHIMFFAVNSTDHYSGVTSKVEGDFTVYISLNGGGFATVDASDYVITERAYGWYDLEITDTTTYLRTLGEMVIHITCSGVDPIDIKMVVCNATMDDLGIPVTIDSVATIFAILNKLAGTSFSTTTDSLKILSDTMDTGVAIRYNTSDPPYSGRG